MNEKILLSRPYSERCMCILYIFNENNKTEANMKLLGRELATIHRVAVMTYDLIRSTEMVCVDCGTLLSNISMLSRFA